MEPIWFRGPLWLTKDFQIRAFDGELCQMADTPSAVKPTRAAIAT